MKKEFLERLAEAVKKMDAPLGELDYLQAAIRNEIESLEELLGEVKERQEKLACAVDLNKKLETD